MSAGIELDGTLYWQTDHKSRTHWTFRSPITGGEIWFDSTTNTAREWRVLACALDELAALKARRCDGCKWWDRGQCLALSRLIETRADFSCAAWEPKP